MSILIAYIGLDAPFCPISSVRSHLLLLSPPSPRAVQGLDVETQCLHAAGVSDVERFELCFVTSPSPLSVGLFFPSDRDGHRIGVGLGAPDDAATPDHAEACVRAAAPAYRIAPQDRLASRVSAPDHR